MSVWTSNYAIMRDLSKAQGRIVPIDINSTIGVDVSANEKPPQLATEETEEEFYKNFVCANVDYSAAPDIGLIQQMLEMVKGEDDSSDGSIVEDLIQITKFNNQSTLTNKEKQPNKVKAKPKGNKIKRNAGEGTNTQVKDEDGKPIPIEAEPNLAGGDTKKKKQHRNVAVMSLLAALESRENKEPLKLLKPTDFISKKAVKDSVRKVDEWFTNKENSAPKQAKNIPSLTSFPMFKKKSMSEKSVTPPQRCTQPQSPSKSTGTYKPSSKANEYYLKFLEKSQLNNSMKEDIWEKAERLMKEADAKRAAQAEKLEGTSTLVEDVVQVSPDFSQLPDQPDVSDLPDLHESGAGTKLEQVALSEQRHGSSNKDADCVVCQAVVRHGYSIRDVPKEE